jgi:DNA-binding Lrp family transcriptional regulator
MKDVELRLVSELMKNSRRSDRELAKAIGTSQPTVTRLRTRLQNEGFIAEYTMIPNYLKLGFHIAAFSFFRVRESLNAKELVEARGIGQQVSKDGFPEVIVCERGSGLGCQVVSVSFHKDYAAYMDFLDSLRQLPLLGRPEIESFIINLDDKTHYRSLTFQTLASYVLGLKEKT